MGFYDKHILLRVHNWSCGNKPVQKQRQKVVPLAEGSMLEIGIGSGLNLPFYDPNKIERVISLDPAGAMVPAAFAVIMFNISDCPASAFMRRIEGFC